MNAVLGITCFYYALFILSAVPLINLKYNHDVASYTESMTYYCHKTEKHKNKIVELPEYHKYLYIICNTLYDTDFDKPIVRESDKMPVHMRIYKEYFDYSIAFFILSWLGFLLYFIIFFLNYSQEYIRLSSIFILFFIVTGITIVYSLILKKITEIYNDTKITEYYNYMTNLKRKLNDYRNNNIKAYKTLSENILYENDKIQTTNLSNIIFNSTTLLHLYNKLKSLPEPTNSDKNQTCEKINLFFDQSEKQDPRCEIIIKDYYKFHNKDHIKTLKYKIDVVCSYLIAYFIMLVIFVFFIVKILKEHYDVNVNILFMVIIVAYILALILYYVIRYLH